MNFKNINDSHNYSQKNIREEYLKRGVFGLIYRVKKVMDDWFLDPLIGLLFPGLGDFFTSFVTLPSLYVSIVKLRAFKLSCAILYTMLIDWLCGLVPFIGNIFDVFFRSNAIAYSLTIGYIEQDSAILRSINRRAIGLGVLLLLVGIICYFAFSIIVDIFNYFHNIYVSMF